MSPNTDKCIEHFRGFYVSRVGQTWGSWSVEENLGSSYHNRSHLGVIPVYSAPEVLGLDSNNEVSDYTNFADIWSLGCVIYELFVGTKLFISEGQVSRYYFGKWPFPEDTLKRLSPPIDDPGISLLKSMLIMQPEDRPTPADALSHGWLAFLRSDEEDNRDNENERRQTRDESPDREAEKQTSYI
ncbi:kinase-like domain-containing protein [Tuber borchii]|uniref:Kinase-like domain-containing protein n=1 Tax=Tuber borchii TaxID=42251 RepID=A0A2T7A261_TUBBO|nr:kinase-like domain-containing protein [Tuber borchii]